MFYSYAACFLVSWSYNPAIISAPSILQATATATATTTAHSSTAREAQSDGSGNGGHWQMLRDVARCCEMLRCTDRKMNLDEHRWTTIESYRIGHEIFESYNCAYLWLSVHAFWRTVQVQPLGCVRRSGIFNSFPSRSDHPAEVACLQSFSEDAQSLGRFVSLEMRLWSFVCICQVAVKLLQVFPRSFQDWLNGVNLSRNSFIVQDETASVVHGFTTAGTGVRDFNMILLIRKLRVGSAAILGCGSS